MNMCNICYEDLDEKNTCVFILNIDNNVYNETSKTCLDCNQTLILSMLPTYLHSIAIETCEASIKRMMMQKLPTHLTVDSTPAGKKVDKMKVNNRVINTELLTNLTKERIEELNNHIERIHNLILNDDDMYVYEKNIAFEDFL